MQSSVISFHLHVYTEEECLAQNVFVALLNSHGSALFFLFFNGSHKHFWDIKRKYDVAMATTSASICLHLFFFFLKKRKYPEKVVPVSNQLMDV